MSNTFIGVINMYKIKTSTKDDVLLIQLTSKATNADYYFTKKEVKFISDPIIKKYIEKRMHFIESGAYE